MKMHSITWDFYHLPGLTLDLNISRSAGARKTEKTHYDTIQLLLTFCWSQKKVQIILTIITSKITLTVDDTSRFKIQEMQEKKEKRLECPYRCWEMGEIQSAACLA